ncbi:MAG: hypothetical protein A4E57_02121 [Syntrophorhabdaceae bacterium PtaU1.Bin034]|nr:MAG: hypothetical protein A4E57_02121 [Syntrophorhabdaceae bacterium PtaU1.Bin034]
MGKDIDTMKPKDKDWIEAKKRYHLTDTHIRMAKELGMNPRKFGSLANHKQEQWKAPLPEFIEKLYFKRFRRDKPENTAKNS